VRFAVSLALCGAVGAAALSGAASRAAPESPPVDAVRALEAKVLEGQARLDAGPVHGRLPALLKSLDIPTDSQVLVFSKTSLQFQKIDPASPRAVYFNDDTTIGAVRGGELLEIITTGADGRPAFYLLDTDANGAPRFEEEGVLCIACHAAVGRWSPGLIIASVIPQEDGAPLFVTIDRLFDMTDSTTPFEKRWGGWYVTGEHGRMRHAGNVHATSERPSDLHPTAGLNVTNLSSLVDVRPYLEPTSDIVALMTLEHQAGALNRIWQLQAQSRPANGARRPSEAELAASIEELVSYLVGANEVALPDPVKGVSTFSRTFPQRGPRDSRGRSLRDFDLRSQLFRYPLSYTVYSRAFDALEPQTKARVYRRLYEVLSGADRSGAFARIPAGRGREALEILRATKADFPADLKAAT
jgi:hypothetical protein